MILAIFRENFNQRQSFNFCPLFILNMRVHIQTAKKKNTDRISYTHIFYPHNHAVNSIVLENVKLLQNDSETGTIFATSSNFTQT